MELNTKQKTRLFFILIAYAVVNILSVILTFRSVPRMFVFIFWGAIAPLIVGGD